MMMYVMKFLGVIWFLMWYVPREGVLLLLGLPLHVAFAGEIAIIVLMVRSPENRERLLLSAILLPLHALMYPLLLTFAAGETTAIAFIEIYVFSAPVLAVGMITYLICLCRWKRMNRYLWTAAAVWVLYFASVGSPILFLLLLGGSMGG